MTAMTKEAAEDLRPKVQEMLNEWCAEHRTTFTLKITAVEQQYDWTIYVVEPDQGEAHLYEWASALADVEGRLANEKNVPKVKVLPMLPQD
jgi:hypothetical protein